MADHIRIDGLHHGLCTPIRLSLRLQRDPVIHALLFDVLIPASRQGKDQIRGAIRRAACSRDLEFPVAVNDIDVQFPLDLLDVQITAAENAL